MELFAAAVARSWSFPLALFACVRRHFLRRLGVRAAAAARAPP